MADPTNNRTDAEALAERDGIQRAFGVVLRRLRDERSMSQEALSGETGIDRSFLAKMEAGRRQPTITTFIRLSKALGVAPSEMMQAVEREGEIA